MKLYFAPMEGVTTYTYRNTHEELFGGCDTYFSPFITPTENEKISMKNLRDIVPEHNRVPLLVQFLVNQEKAFLDYAEKIKTLGYDAVNLNLGCPSGTVVKKRKGSGFLKDPEGLDAFLCGIFQKSDMKISIKTRTGFFSHEEFERLLEIFNQYPLAELIVHPRVREDFYKNVPNMEAFEKAYQGSKNPLCYNGDIVTKGDFEKIKEAYSNLSGVMIGRGALRNPALFREIKGGKPLMTEELVAFSHLLEERYLKVLGSEVYTLHKLKEIWLHMMLNFPEEKKLLKAVKKANSLKDLNYAICALPQI